MQVTNSQSRRRSTLVMLLLIAGAACAAVLAGIRNARHEDSYASAPVSLTQSGNAHAASGKSEADGGVEFDAARAWALLLAQCELGPRPPGSAAHEKTRDLLASHLRPLVDEFTMQEWTQTIRRGPGAGRSYKMTNLLGVIRGKDVAEDAADWGPSLMLCAHWDTRPVADMEIDAAKRTKPIMGANDGASGVAAVVEIARVLKAARPRQTVIIALWDGEDLGEFFYGSRYFANSLSTAAWKKWRPSRAILLDMIGDRDLRCNRELNSLDFAPELYQEVMDAAAKLGLSRHFNGPSTRISDDHVPLHEAGIPAIDLIDFDYPYWHTLEDTPDKCSPASLKVIGDVLLRLIADEGKV